MLNRRTLRIKAMQSLFAYEQCKEANYHLALERIDQAFQPDLNSMEPQDKNLLKAQGKEARELFKKHYKNPDAAITTGSDTRINEVVREAIDFYYKQLDKDRRFLKQEMLKDPDRIYGRFAWLLHWLPAFVELLQKAKPKKELPPYDNMLNNRLIPLLKEHGELAEIYKKSGLGWDNFQDEIFVWFKEIILKDEAFLDYLRLDEPGFEDDRQIALHLYKGVIFKHEIVNLFMEQQDLYWSENKAILKSLIQKTLKSIQPGEADFELAVLSYNWEEDREFFERIFDLTSKHGGEYEELIAAKTSNWDIERLSDTDRILLLMAIQELVNFPEIPVKVTINEYIEVSKRYSTPKSKQFINGVLDVIAVDLHKKGTIKKSGRGLIDNK
ncbi:MAG TPA: transcription antitermination factor NusB [Flammeovirgaceae bacterium]|nr:transcription antitermination factor NusB [Flammeovirgaceae bacterium]